MKKIIFIIILISIILIISILDININTAKPCQKYGHQSIYTEWTKDIKIAY